MENEDKHELTYGITLGHFMMVDSVEQFTNETARLLSPMYPANYSTNACFSFYYHMYGDGVGTLSVYVRPASQQLDSYSSKDAIFSLKGNQRNVWNEGYFDLKQFSEEFQIVIEASLGMKAKSDIAIDDVSLLYGEDCRPKAESEDEEITPEVLPPDVPSDDNIFKLGSCENRCGVNVSSVVTIPDTSVNFVQCDCFEGCVDSKTCCPDYAERCVFNETAFAASTISTSTKILPSTTETTRPTTTPTTSTTTTTIRTTQPTTKPTTTPTKPTTTSTRPTTPRSTSTTAVQTSSSTTIKTTLKPKVPTTTTTKSYNLRPRNITTTSSTTTKPMLLPMVRTRRPTTSTTTTTSTPTTEEVVLKLVARFGDVSSEEFPASVLEYGDNKPNLARVFLFSGIGVVSFGCVILLIVLHIRRNSGENVLNRLKQKSMKSKLGSNEGFEDVRFLAADEHLDFSLPDDEVEEAVEGGDGNNDAEQKPSKKGKK